MSFGNYQFKFGIVTPTATMTTWMNTLPWAVYNASPTVRTEGQGGPLQSDSVGSLLSRETYAPNYENNTDSVAMVHMRAMSTTTGAVSVDNSSALEASTISKASAGRFYGISGYIDATAASGTYYLQVLNHASVPSDGAVTFLLTPIQIVHNIGSPTYFDIDYRNLGIFASTGITTVMSTTQFTKTITGSIWCSTILWS